LVSKQTETVFNDGPVFSYLHSGIGRQRRYHEYNDTSLSQERVDESASNMVVIFVVEHKTHDRK